MKPECKMSEKQRYWTEFESTRHQFFKVMIRDLFKDGLRIPREFKNNFKEKLLETIGLRGPSGLVWDVKLRKGTDDWFFQNGWEIFVQDHGLEEADFLVFSYDENSTFKVTIFDKSGCEREGAYFINKHTSSCEKFCCTMESINKDKSEENVIIHDEVEEKNTKKGEVKEGRGNRSSKGFVTNTRHHQKKRFRVKSKNTGSSKPNESQTSSDVAILPSTCNRKERKRTEYVDPVPSLGISEPSEEGDSVESEDANSDSVTRHGNRKEKHGTDKAPTDCGCSQVKDSDSEETRLPETKYSFYLMSKRRKVTEKEIQRAYKLATKHESPEPYITLVMKPTNVYKYFFVNIPKEWARNHMPRTNNSKIHLKVPPCEKIWYIKWKCNTYKTGFSKGWCKFVMDNNLEEHDVCVFKLIEGGKETKKTPVFDVIISRVVDEIVSMTHLMRKPQLK